MSACSLRALRRGRASTIPPRPLLLPMPSTSSPPPSVGVSWMLRRPHTAPDIQVADKPQPPPAALVDRSCRLAGLGSRSTPATPTRNP